MNQRRAVTERAQFLAEERRRRVRRNKQIGQLKGLTKGSSLLSDEQAIILSAIDKIEKSSLPPRSRNPKKLSREAFITDLVVHLVEYVSRTTGEVNDRKPTSACFRTVTKILHLATGGEYVGGARGAARVKDRFWRSRDWK